MRVGVCFPQNNFFCAFVHAADVSEKDAFNLRRSHGQSQISPDLLRNFVQAANHAQFQTPAGGGVGNTVVQTHQVHRPTANVRQNDRGFIQQIRLGQYRGVALGEQGNLCDSDCVGTSFKTERNRRAVSEEILTEFLLVPTEAGKRQPSRKMYSAGGVSFTEFQLFRNCGQRQQVVVFRQGFVLLEGLAAASDNVIFAAKFQYIFLRIRLVLVLNQPCREGEIFRFHCGIAIVDAYGQEIVAHFLHLFDFLISRSST